MSEIVDSIVVKIVADVDDAQRRIAAYRGSAEQAFGRVERAAARGGAQVARSAAGQGAAYSELAGQLSKAAIEVSMLEAVDPEPLAKISRIGGALAQNLSRGLAEAVANGKSLGDVLVDSFARAGQALIAAKILQLLDPAGDGSAGFVRDSARLFGTILGARKAPGRASGGHVSAGQLYRVNEAGIEGFRPAGSGKIVPLGRMAAQPGGGGVTVVQPLNVSFAGAIATPELMAQFKAYADSVGQAAAIGGAAMAQARLARRAARALPR